MSYDKKLGVAGFRVCLLVAIALVSIFSSSAMAEVLGPSLERNCFGTVCTNTLYSGIRYVLEDEKYVKIEESTVSLLPYFTVKVLEQDPNYNVTLKSLTWDSISFDVKTSTKVAGSIPITAFDYDWNAEKQSFEESNKVDMSALKTAGKQEVSMDKNAMGGSPIMKTYKFGLNSTLITLDGASPESLDDGYAYEALPDTVQDSGGTGTNFYVGGRNGARNEHAYKKWNISSISAGSTIINATQCFQSFEMDALANTVVVHHAYLQDWDESDLTWNNQPCGTSTMANSSNCNATNSSRVAMTNTLAWYCFESTSGVEKDLAAGNQNSSWGFMLDIEGTGDNYYKEFYTKEVANASAPYMNITYDEAVLSSPHFAISLVSNQSNSSMIYSGTNFLSARFNSSSVSNVWFSSNESGSWKNYTSAVYNPYLFSLPPALLGHFENFTTNPTYWNDTDTGTASNCADCDLLLNYTYTQDNYTFTIRYTETALDEEMKVLFWNASGQAWQLLQTLPISALNQLDINMTIPENDSVEGKLLLNVHMASTGGTGGVYEVWMTNRSVPVINSSMLRWYGLTWQNTSVPIGARVNWTIYLNNSNGNETVSPVMSFLVTQPSIGACSASSAYAKRLVLLNETKPFDAVNGTIEAYFETLVGGSIYTYNFSVVNYTAYVCMSPSNINITGTGQLRYYSNGTAGEYSIRNYFFRDVVFDNVTEDWNLYMLPTTISTLISFKVQDQYSTPIIGAYLSIQRWYPDLALYKTVAVPLTDSNGNALAYLVQYDVYYRFLIYRLDGTLLQTIPMMLISGNTITLSTSTNVQSSWLKYYGKLYGACTYSNSTKYLSCLYYDNSGNLQSVSLKVTKQGALIQSVLCDYTNTSLNNGTFRCYMGASPDASIQYVMQAYMDDGMRLQLAAGPIPYGSTSTQLFGDCTAIGNMGACKEGLMVSFFIILMAALIGAWNPMASVVLTTASLFGVVYMGLFALAPEALLGVMLSAALMIFRMRD